MKCQLLLVHVNYMLIINLMFDIFLFFQFFHNHFCYFPIRSFNNWLDWDLGLVVLVLLPCMGCNSTRKFSFQMDTWFCGKQFDFFCFPINWNWKREKNPEKKKRIKSEMVFWATLTFFLRHSPAWNDHLVHWFLNWFLKKHASTLQLISKFHLTLA